MTRTLLAAALLTLLAACGQKGPLFLPDRNDGGVVVTPGGAAARPADADPAATEATPAIPEPGSEPDKSNETRRKIH